jgi:hypothetical protein
VAVYSPHLRPAAGSALPARRTYRSGCIRRNILVESCMWRCRGE